MFKGPLKGYTNITEGNMRRILDGPSGVLLLLFLLTNAGTAQPIWVNYGPQKTISLEILKPDLDSPSELTLPSTATIGHIRWPLNESFFLVGEFAFAYGKGDFPGADGKVKIGNPYLGLDFRPAKALNLEFGVRLPLVSTPNIATFVGQFSDSDRFEAFMHDILMFGGAAGYRLQPDNSNLYLRLRGGTSLFFQIQDRTDAQGRKLSNAEWFFLGNLIGGYESERLRVEAGFTGRLVFTGDGLPGARSFAQVGGALSYLFGSVRPGIHIRLPLDEDLRETIDLVVGLTLECYFD